MTSPTQVTESWISDSLLEAVHKTVLGAPAVVRNNREMIQAAQTIIAQYLQDIRDPQGSLTVRQIFYQLIEAIGLPNKESQYNKVSRVLTAARIERVIPWGHITDRSRSILTVNMWNDIVAFARDATRSYRGDVWATQEQKVMCWVEKDARAAWVKQIVEPYGVHVVPGRGASSWGLINDAALVMGDGYGWSVPYFGDFDPSGLVIGEHIRMGLAALGCRPEWRVLAVRHEDMPRISRAAWQEPKRDHYDPKKKGIVKGDPNTPGFLKKYGQSQKCAEVDSMPPALLRARILSAVQNRLDMPAWRRRMRLDSAEKVDVYGALTIVGEDADMRRARERNARAYALAYASREDLEEAERNRQADYEGLHEDGAE
jgi:hypothetical protein